MITELKYHCLWFENLSVACTNLHHVIHVFDPTSVVLHSVVRNVNSRFLHVLGFF